MIRKQPCEEQLEQLQKDFEEFAYIVSHDFKAPIRAISNLSHWIEEDLGDNLGSDVQENVNLLRNRAQRLERMIDALLLYSRVARYSLETMLTDTNQVVQSAAAKFEGKINLQLPQPLPAFVTYRDKLYEVFLSLISNSATFSEKTLTTVTVSCHSTDSEYYEFVVADNGAGVPESALDKIFNLFYTVSAKDNQDTVGAGLAISKKIIQFVQGNIRAENNDENGLTIRFTWPKTITATTTSYKA